MSNKVGPYVDGPNEDSTQPQSPPQVQIVHQNTNVVIGAVPVVTQEKEPVPDDYLCYAVLACLCCFWPLGIVAIIFSCFTSDANSRRDYEEALQKSVITRRLVVGTVLAGIALYIIVIIAAAV